MINIKHQSRLKVLKKFYYSKRDTSATLVEAVFKLINQLCNGMFCRMACLESKLLIV